MRMELMWLKIRNFKGVTSFDYRFDGKNATITAENAKGKTTIYDSELWLFFGKDSTGRSDFGIVPIDRFSQPRKGLTISVEAGFRIDDVETVFKKEQTEKVTKAGRITGYEKQCYINEVPKLLNEYEKYIAEHITSENRFRELTNLKHINTIMPWKELRNTLQEIAGDAVTEPEGYEELKAELVGKEGLDDLKSVLKSRLSNKQKSGYKDKLEQINPRIDEIMRGLAEPDFDVTEQEEQREKVRGEVKNIIDKRTTLRKEENERQGHIDEVNRLERIKSKREAELASDTSAVTDLIKKKQDAHAELSKLFDVTNESVAALKALHRQREEAQADQGILLKRLSEKRVEIDDFEAIEVSTICSECEQKYPVNKIDLILKKRKDKIIIMNKAANELMKHIESSEPAISELDEKIIAAKDLAEENRQTYEKMHTIYEQSNIEIEKQIKSTPTPRPEEDNEWIQICMDIKIAEEKIGEPVTIQLDKLDAEQANKQVELNKINEALAQADRFEQDKVRMQELKDEESQLGQDIANVDKLLNDIELYRAEESTMITNAVNGLFKYTKFKLFKEYLSEGLKECCVATLNGTLYPNLSTGEGIRVGIDEVNVFSKFYDCWVPLFIDHAESMTFPIEANCQTIQLVAKDGVEELEVTTI